MFGLGKALIRSCFSDPDRDALAQDHPGGVCVPLLGFCF